MASRGKALMERLAPKEAGNTRYKKPVEYYSGGPFLSSTVMNELSTKSVPRYSQNLPIRKDKDWYKSADRTPTDFLGLSHANYLNSLKRAAGGFGNLTESYVKTLHAVAGIDNNFIFDGKSFIVDGDFRTMNKTITKTLCNNLNKQIILSSADPKAQLILRYHQVTAKLCSQLNGVTKYIRSLANLYRTITDSTDEVIGKKAARIEASAYKSFYSEPRDIIAYKVSRSAKAIVDAGVSAEVVNEGKTIANYETKLKNDMLTKRYGDADQYKELMKDRNKTMNAIQRDVTKRLDYTSATWKNINTQGASVAGLKRLTDADLANAINLENVAGADPQSLKDAYDTLLLAKRARLQRGGSVSI